MSDILDINKLLKGAPAPSTEMAYDGDVKYFWAWAKVSAGIEEEYPVSQEVMKQFIVEHVVGLEPDIDQQLINLGVKKKPGRHKVSTIRRRFAGIINRHHLNDFNDIEYRTHYIKTLLRAAQRHETQEGKTTRQVKAITRKELNRIMKTYKGKLSLKDMRDQAMLIFGFYTGGRRGSEIVNAKFDDLYPYENGYKFNLASSKTDQLGKGDEKVLRNPHSEYLTRWIKEAEITDGYLFRSISRNGTVTDNKFDVRLLREIIKERVEMIGLNPDHFSNHSLRRGFLTQCGRDGYSLSDAMQLSGHKDTTTALRYYEQGRIEFNEATKMNTKKH